MAPVGDSINFWQFSDFWVKWVSWDITLVPDSLEQGCATFTTEGPNAIKQIRLWAALSFHTGCLVLVTGIKIHFVVLHLARRLQVAHLWSRRSIKGSIDSGDHVVSTKSLSQNLGSLDWRPVPVKVGLNLKNTHFGCSSQENPLLK